MPVRLVYPELQPNAVRNLATPRVASNQTEFGCAWGAKGLRTGWTWDRQPSNFPRTNPRPPNPHHVMTQHVAGVSMIIVKIHWRQHGNWRMLGWQRWIRFVPRPSLTNLLAVFISVVLKPNFHLRWSKVHYPCKFFPLGCRQIALLLKSSF